MNLLTFDGEETPSQRAARLAQEAEAARVKREMEALAAASLRQKQMDKIDKQKAARTKSPDRTGNAGSTCASSRGSTSK